MDSYTPTLAWAVGTIAFIVLSSLGVARLARAIVRRRGASPRVQARTYACYLFAAPWIVGFVLFVVIPMGASLYWSFTRFDPPNSPQWVGFDNYVRLLTDDRDLRVALMNSLYMVAFGLPIQTGRRTGSGSAPQSAPTWRAYFPRRPVHARRAGSKRRRPAVLAAHAERQ